MIIFTYNIGQLSFNSSIVNEFCKNNARAKLYCVQMIKLMAGLFSKMADQRKVDVRVLT